MSSMLAEVAVDRAIRRAVLAALPAVPAGLGTVFCSSSTRRAGAVALADPLLRSLDAIHLATALEFGSELQAFVVYYRRLRTAAAATGLTVVCPGADCRRPR